MDVRDKECVYSTEHFLVNLLNLALDDHGVVILSGFILKCRYDTVSRTW